MIATAVNGLFVFVSATNLLWMRRPGVGPSQIDPACDLSVAIPCRNEAENIGRLVRSLREDDPSVTILVFDDESTDGTAEIARAAGATVLTPSEPLPPGWTGKNRACDALGQAVDREWFIFLDADTYPKPGFIDAMRALVAGRANGVKLITGFPQVRSGRGVEPLFLYWVGWILLASNPFGVVRRTARGHNRFANGQFQLWNTATYKRLRPHHAVRDRILEDILIGRLLARLNTAVETANVSGVLAVRMYDNWRETLDGMSKNSFEVAGTTTGSLLLAAALMFTAWGWLAAPTVALPLLILSGVFAELIAGRRPFVCLFAPIGITIGALTVLRSIYWRRTGKTTWKGRTYANS